MTKFLKNIFYIISFLAAVAAIIGFYFQITTPKPVIEIKTISTDKLTDLPTVDGLKALYTYKNDTVKSLWKLHYYINNSGDEILIGEGNKKNIIRNGLDFSINNNYRIIEYRINKKNFPFNTKLRSNIINLSFLQWKPGENLDLIIYAEQLKKVKSPDLKINEREIINGEVKYSTIYKEIGKKESTFEYLPKPLQQVLWWFAIISFGLVEIFCPIGFFIELAKLIKYKKWKKEDLWMYDEWIDKLIKEGELDSYKKPEDLAYYHWLNYPYIKPNFPNKDFKSMTIGLIILSVLCAIPILLLIKV